MIDPRTREVWDGGAWRSEHWYESQRRPLIVHRLGSQLVIQRRLVLRREVEPRRHWWYRAIRWLQRWMP